jgi:acyl-CoA synthetase (AMP-forming)/AMP-acid ligase II
MMTYYPQLQTIAETIVFHAQHQPNTVALIHESDSITYIDLNRSSNRTAYGIKIFGLQPGARVAYLGKESIAYYDVLFGCAKSLTVLVPINWRLTAEEVEHILKDSGTQLIFVDLDLKSMVTQLYDSLPELLHVIVVDGSVDEKIESAIGFKEWQQEFPGDDHQLQGKSEDAIAQLYTSGTTGLPKGVVLAHRSFFKIRESLAKTQLDWIDWQPGDISLIGIPGFHIGGLWWAMQGFAAGITNVAMKVFVPHEAVKLIEELRITIACVVPAMIQMMLSDRKLTETSFTSLRKLVYGGSPISETLLEQGLQIMQCSFAQIYGLTETGNTAICLPPQAHIPGSPRMKAAGLPYPGVSLKVIDRDGELLPVGEIGEVCIRTPACMIEYWKNPQATKTTLIDSWIHTGDVGYLDTENYLYIFDRIKDVIIVAGENVYPTEVENALSKHSAVFDVAVIGIPDKRWGESIKAFVVLRDEQQVSARELLLFLKGKIADYKTPSQFDFINNIPRNPSGKILRRKLRDQYWMHMDRKVN